MEVKNFDFLRFVDVGRRIFILGSVIVGIIVRQQIINSAGLIKITFPILSVIGALVVTFLSPGNRNNQGKYILTEIIYGIVGFILGISICFSLLGRLVSQFS